jgi:tetratricopeptide (TPR) repeat protein
VTTVLKPYAPRLYAVFPWLVALVALAVYANALQNGFAFDDEGIVLHNGLVHGIDGTWRAFLTPYWPNGAGQYRPLVIASFSAEWALWGSSAIGYHAINLVWHAAASVLVYALARRWLSFGGAAFAALLFAVQPVHVEAVSNVVGRGELMATCGVLGMLLLHGKRSPWAIVAFGAALLSKEHAVMAVILAAGIDLVDRAPAPKPRETDARDRVRSVKPLYIGYAVVTLAWVAAAVMIFQDRPFAAVDPFWSTMDAGTRWLTMLGVVPVWTRLWFWPLDLSSDYSPQATHAWPENLSLAVLGSTLLACALFLLIARRKTPAVVIAVFWLAVAMLPVANLLAPTGVIVAERTLYLSSVGAVLLVGYAAQSLALRQTALTLTLVAIAAGVFADRTWRRTPVWKSNRALFLETVATHPEASWTHVLLGRVYAGNGGYPDALNEYRIALSLFDRNPVTSAEAVDVAVRAREYAFADSVVTQATARFKGNYLTAIAHAYAAFEQHRYSEALRAAQLATSIAPDSARARYFAALAWLGLGAPDSARAALAHVPADHPLRKSADSLRGALPPGT